MPPFKSSITLRWTLPIGRAWWKETARILSSLIDLDSEDEVLRMDSETTNSMCYTSLLTDALDSINLSYALLSICHSFFLFADILFSTFDSMKL
ncbi:unnamed protein product [Brassica rapa subsp. trilocularis]